MDEAFVHQLHGSTLESHTDASVDLHDMLVDYFNDYFDLTSKQRKEVKHALLSKSRNIRELFEQYEIKTVVASPAVAGVPPGIP